MVCVLSILVCDCSKVVCEDIKPYTVSFFDLVLQGQSPAACPRRGAPDTDTAARLPLSAG